MFKNQCVSEENSLRIQKEEEFKVFSKTSKKKKETVRFPFLKLIEKEEKLSKFNVRNINKRIERKRTQNENLMKENKGKRLQFVESIENHKETEKKIGEKQFQLVELIAEHKRLEKKSSECLAENSRLK